MVAMITQPITEWNCKQLLKHLGIFQKANITLVTDSKYVKDGIQSWIQNWKKNGWKTAAKKPVKNKNMD